jgi:hypothetical protein
MKVGPDALGTAENVSGSVKHENGTRRRRYRRKWVMERKTLKLGPTSSVPPKMSLGPQNMKTGPDALGTAKSVSESAKHGKRDMSASVPLKMSRGAQNMKTGSNALGTAENGSGCVKHENGTGRPMYRRKRVRERKT